jgi:hypothetical protein
MLIAQSTTPSRLAPASTSVHQIFDLSVFVIAITGVIFLLVGEVALYRFGARKTYPLGEPGQIDGSTQIELAGTVLPLPIVVVLFLTTLLDPIERRINEPIFPSSLAHFIQRLFSRLLAWLAKNLFWWPYWNYGVAERTFRIDTLENQIAAVPSCGCSGHWCFSLSPSL